MPDLPNALRKFIFERARGRCEYCLIHQEDSFVTHEVDHIISRKHGGADLPENLALACAPCNYRKGSDIAGLDSGGRLVPLFHAPRDVWEQHFVLRGGELVPITPVAEVTARLLRLNDGPRRNERSLLIAAARYPR
jgi:hypothetical protein